MMLYVGRNYEWTVKKCENDEGCGRQIVIIASTIFILCSVSIYYIIYVMPFADEHILYATGSIPWVTCQSSYSHIEMTKPGNIWVEKQADGTFQAYLIDDAGRRNRSASEVLSRDRMRRRGVR